MNEPIEFNTFLTSEDGVETGELLKDSDILELINNDTNNDDDEINEEEKSEAKPISYLQAKESINNLIKYI